jgi:hypothetical protein
MGREIESRQGIGLTSAFFKKVIKGHYVLQT